jgi:hypothetical protein
MQFKSADQLQLLAQDHDKLSLFSIDSAENDSHLDGCKTDDLFQPVVEGADRFSSLEIDEASIVEACHQ